MENMIKNFRIDSFRSLSSVGLDDLKRVNLFVGRNGAGKTSILEAVYLLFSEARFESLVGIAERRGEFDKTDDGVQWLPSIRHFFAGHFLPQNCEGVRLKAGDMRLSIDVCIENRPAKNDYRVVLPTPMCHVTHAGFNGDGVGKLSFPISKSGALEFNRAGDGGYNRLTSPEDVPTVFVSPDGVEPAALLRMRDDVISRGAECDLVKVLKQLNPDVESVGFLSSADKNYKFLANGTLVGLAGTRDRVPVKTLGDGIRRLLVIAMGMVCAKNGVLILDEIDSGLHYSAMQSLWTFIVKAAEANNVQVFASTHSIDCLRGLASVCGDDQSTADDVRLYSLSNIGKRVVCYTGHEVSVAMNREIEVRA